MVRTVSIEYDVEDQGCAVGAPTAAYDLAHATAVLNRAGVRSMRLDAGQLTGIWSDLDSPVIREALRVLEADQLPVRYLDGPGVLVRYKLRCVAGEPIPENVRVEMERHPADPWTIRDRMLGAIWSFAPWPLKRTKHSGGTKMMA